MAVASRIRYKPRKCKGLGCDVVFIPTKRDHIYHDSACRWYMANRKRRNGNGKQK